LHLHHLLHRRVVCQLFPHLDPRLKNGFTSPMCWILNALPCGLALLFMHNTAALAASLLLMTCLYAAIYCRLSQFRWSFWR
jgi:hypothetical protein